MYDWWGQLNTHWSDVVTSTAVFLNGGRTQYDLDTGGVVPGPMARIEQAYDREEFLEHMLERALDGMKYAGRHLHAMLDCDDCGGMGSRAATVDGKQLMVPCEHLGVARGGLDALSSEILAIQRDSHTMA